MILPSSLYIKAFQLAFQLHRRRVPDRRRAHCIFVPQMHHLRENLGAVFFSGGSLLMSLSIFRLVLLASRRLLNCFILQRTKRNREIFFQRNAISNLIPWRNNVSHTFSMSVHRRVRQSFPVKDAVSGLLVCIQYVSYASHDKIKPSTTCQPTYREAVEESDTNYHCRGAHQNFSPFLRYSAYAVLLLRHSVIKSNSVTTARCIFPGGQPFYFTLNFL